METIRAGQFFRAGHFPLDAHPGGGPQEGRDMNFKQVSKSEFEAFLSYYPRTLEVDITGICDPPLKSYNDFTLGSWPDSMVAKVRLFEERDGSPDQYFILANAEKKGEGHV